MARPARPDARPDVGFRLRAFPAAVFADLLRDAGAALDARELKRRLVATGIEAAVVDAAWKRAQPSLRRHSYVEFHPPGRYRWRDGRDEPRLPPEVALDRLLTERLNEMGRAELADRVRTALAERDELEARARGAYQEAASARVATERQLRVDAARALAEVAMEVEELAEAGASPAVTVERIRALAAGFGLVPIGRAGERAPFDPVRHTPFGAAVQAGTVVSIIRPGYTWQAADQGVLIAKAQVAPV